MAAIKKLFAKKLEEAKFKLATGSSSSKKGHKLNAEPSSSATGSKSSKNAYKPPPKRKDLSVEARAAAEAALARIEKKEPKEFNTSLAAIKAQAKRELEAERKAKEELEQEKKLETIKDEKVETEQQQRVNKNLACQGVYFRCPLISDEILPKNEWKIKIKEFLYQQLDEEKGLTACLIILNCNVKEKADGCVETLSKYIENLINHPDEEKYHKIRMSNRIFCDKVRHVEGALEFLSAAGFIEQELDGEPYLLWFKNDTQEVNHLQTLLDALHCSETIHLELDRNIQVLLPSQGRRNELPQDFYRISAEELKREQQLRAAAIENAQILKTKAMREREELRQINKYKFALVRIRFPDGIYLQGTFNVYEKLNDIYEFVQSCLQDEGNEFLLTAPAGLKFSDEDTDKTLYDLRLIPNTILSFISEFPQQNERHYLKDEILMLVQPM